MSLVPKGLTCPSPAAKARPVQAGVRPIWAFHPRRPPGPWQRLPRRIRISPLQCLREQVDERADTALIYIPQSGVLGDLDDPDPGIAQEGAEQFKSF